MKKNNVVWKINMIDGKSHYVLTDIVNMEVFIRDVLPISKDNEKVSMFKCFNEKIELEHIYNSVVIIGSKVVSVEFYSMG